MTAVMAAADCSWPGHANEGREAFLTGALKAPDKKAFFIFTRVQRRIKTEELLQERRVVGF
jgi:hypothetical protein